MTKSEWNKRKRGVVVHSSSTMASKQMREVFALALTMAIIAIYFALQVNNVVLFPSYMAATKARHDQVPGEILKTELAAHIPPNCEAVQLNILSRHGSRFPSEGSVEDFQTLFHKLMTSVPDSNLTKYLSKFLREVAAQEATSALSLQGQQDMKFLATKFCENWPHLCSNNADELFIQTTYKARTIETAFWYAYELLGLASNPDFQSVSSKKEARFHQVKSLVEKLKENSTFQINDENDDLLRFYDACDRYVVSVDNNESALYESEKFVHSEVYLSEASHFNESMCSLYNACALDINDLHHIHSLCKHAVMLYNDYQSCQGIHLEYMQVAEYLSDLDVYYEKHRGFDINYKPACKLMGTIARDIERVTRRSCDGKQCHVIPENTQIPNGFKHIMRVGHAETLLPVLASFNIVPTKPLTAKGYSPFRPFHTGQLTPMAATLAFVTYQCPRLRGAFPNKSTMNHDRSEENEVDHKVLVLLNEAIVRLPNLLGEYEYGYPLLPLDTFLNYLKNLSCNEDKFSDLCEV